MAGWMVGGGGRGGVGGGLQQVRFEEGGLQPFTYT